ncbi:MAG: hypothetical protein WC906_01775 [Parcubacteria group bacterium]|jgi:hypothetical protein
MKKGSFFIFVCAIAFCLSSVAESAEYTIRKGDGWQRIARTVSEVSGIRQDVNLLREANPAMEKLIPGQKINYLTKEEVRMARKWIELCISAGYEDSVYWDVKRDLSNGIIKRDSIRRIMNFAEAYRLDVRPAPVVSLTKLAP